MDLEFVAGDTSAGAGGALALMAYDGSPLADAAVAAQAALDQAMGGPS